MPDVLTLWSLAVLIIGGGLYLVMTRTSPTPTTALANRSPGWIARRRARGGIAHRRSRVGVGYRSATSTAELTARELAHHGAVFGGPGSGKTTFLQLLVEANAGRMPVVIVDPKGSPALASTIRAHGGQVWTLDGRLPADLLDPRPWQVPDLLLEAEEYTADARVYRDGAHQRALWAAWSLALDGKPMDLAELRRRLDWQVLAAALERHRDRDARIVDWLTRLSHQHGGIEESASRGLDRALGTILDGVAMRGSLRALPEALRLDDVMQTNGLVLFSLDAADYPHATRKVASWILLGMARVAHQLGDVTVSSSVAQQRKVTANLTDRFVTSQQESVRFPRALLLVDEVGALGHSARHLRGLVGRARESGLAVVLATQGPSDLEAVDRALLPQVLQDTAWQLVFRQGSPQDAERMAALFGQAFVEDVTRYSDGRVSWRNIERARVRPDEWMNALEPGDAWLRVAPVDRGWRQQRLRVALPRKHDAETAFGNQGRSVRAEVFPPDVSEIAAGPNRPSLRDIPRDLPGAERPRSTPALDSASSRCPQELLDAMGADVLSQVEERFLSRRRELGPCLVWTGVLLQPRREYGRLYDPTLKRSDAAHRVVWRRVFGPIREGMTVDHICKVKLCQRPDHLELVSKPENTRRRHQADRGT
jgi:hypothetical protein